LCAKDCGYVVFADLHQQRFPQQPQKCIRKSIADVLTDERGLVRSRLVLAEQVDFVSRWPGSTRCFKVFVINFANPTKSSS